MSGVRGTRRRPSRASLDRSSSGERRSAKVLNAPYLSVRPPRKATRYLLVRQAAHVRVMTVLREAFPRTLVPHRLKAPFDDVFGGRPSRAFVLGKALRLADLIIETGVNTPLAVVLRMLVRAALASLPARERREALALTAKLIDAPNAVVIGFAGARKSRGRAVGARLGEGPVIADACRFLIAVGTHCMGIAWYQQPCARKGC